MNRAFEFCIPTRGAKVPHTPDWLHEVKYDGYRFERAGNRVRLITATASGADDAVHSHGRCGRVTVMPWAVNESDARSD
jgi:hypothetical protein